MGSLREGRMFRLSHRPLSLSRTSPHLRRDKKTPAQPIRPHRHEHPFQKAGSPGVGRCPADRRRIWLILSEKMSGGITVTHSRRFSPRSVCSSPKGKNKLSAGIRLYGKFSDPKYIWVSPPHPVRRFCAGRTEFCSRPGGGAGCKSGKGDKVIAVPPVSGGNAEKRRNRQGGIPPPRGNGGGDSLCRGNAERGVTGENEELSIYVCDVGDTSFTSKKAGLRKRSGQQKIARTADPTVQTIHFP